MGSGWSLATNTAIDENACQYLGCEDVGDHPLRITAEALSLVFCSRHAEYLARVMDDRANGRAAVAPGSVGRLRVHVVPG
jgi:hypothetical protein